MDHQVNENNEGQCKCSSRLAAAPAPSSQSQHHHHHRQRRASNSNHQNDDRNVSPSSSSPSEKLLPPLLRHPQPPPTPQKNHPPRSSLDPTGMFRNRGRRVIASAAPPAAPSSSCTIAERRDGSGGGGGMQMLLQPSNANNNAAGGVILSSAPSRSSSSSTSPDKIMTSSGIIGYQEEERRRRRRISSREEEEETTVEYYPTPPPLRESSSFASASSPTTATTTTTYPQRKMVERATTTTTTTTNGIEEDSSGVVDDQQDYDDERRRRRRTCDKSNIIPLLPHHHHHRNHGRETNNLSDNEEEEEEREKHPLSPSSDIGSTVSIMGSIIGDDDDDDNNNHHHLGAAAHDTNARLLAVRRRRGRTQEDNDVAEEVIREREGGGGGTTKTTTTKTTTCESGNNPRTSCDDIHNNYQRGIGSLLESSDQVTTILNESELLNVSLECNADTDTSLLEDYPWNHDDHDDGLCPEDGEEHDPDKRDDIGAEILDSKHDDAESIHSSTNNEHSDKWGASGTGTGGSSNTNETRTRKEQESPFRAAFRRSAQGIMSNRLPPIMSTQLRSERLTPNRFQLASASSAIDKAATTASLLPQFARQCFSFEDTTIDDDTFFIMPEHLHAGGEASSGGCYFPPPGPPHKYYGLSGVASFSTIDEGRGDTSSTGGNPCSKRNHPPIIFHPSRQTAGVSSSSAAGGGGEPDSPFRIIRHAQTWNHHGQSSSPATGEVVTNSKHAVTRKDDITHLCGTIRHASSFDPWLPKSGPKNSSELDRGEVSLFAMRNQAVTQASEANNDWKKIETERGDALDILAFMVEHSLKAVQLGHGSHHGLLCDKCQDERRDLLRSSSQNCCSECFAKLKRIAKSANEIGAAESSTGEQHDVSNIDPQLRSDAIDALLRSYEFALEVKRSSLSAKKWLNSIGRSTLESVDTYKFDEILSLNDIPLKARLLSAESAMSTKEGEINRLNEELSTCRAEIGRLKGSHGAQMLRQPIPLAKNKSILSESSSDDSVSDSDLMDNIPKENGPLVLCPSRPTSVKLSDSQDESFTRWEKNIEAQMNLESRKENLLLRAALEKAQRRIVELEKQTAEPFSSEIEPINASSDDGDTFMKIVGDTIGNKALDASRDDTVEDEVPAEINLYDPALEKELEEYRRALIVTIENRISPDDSQIDQDVSKSTSSELTSDRKMINVRMIDGENFSTEWGELVDFPPPPDHDLHSPIVDAILKKWSGDNATRLALIQWMEHILSGANIDAIPSLKLSGLDHQLRDGFVMHVLPLLLRRKDVHVHFTSRAHRQTTYDIAVSVTPTSIGVHNNTHDAVPDSCLGDVEFRKRQLSRESNHHLMAFHATKSGASIKEDTNVHRSPMPFWNRTIPGLIRTPSNAGSISTAVTTPISNRTPSRGPHIPGKSRFTSLLTDNLKKDGSSNLRDDVSMPTMMTVTSPSLGDDLSVGSSVDDDSDNRDHQGQSSIMGSISGAFGLLSRRRKPSPVEKGFQGTSQSTGLASPSALHTPARKIVSNDDEEHSYHRIVSAPPGKIGISFVEYRGHAMVSNVSDDSPLVGWVFPSDVLVAIDDVSVSGLPTREIVKLLTSRVHQQRNLRMISAVASRPGTV